MNWHYWIPWILLALAVSLKLLVWVVRWRAINKFVDPPRFKPLREVWLGSRMVYTKENGYGNIDIYDDRFQVGRRLYETQCWLTDYTKKGFGQGEATPEKAHEIARWYCELVHSVGELRADYSVMRDCAEGKAEFREL